MSLYREKFSAWPRNFRYATLKSFSPNNCVSPILFFLPFIIMDPSVFATAEWAAPLVDIRCPRGGS